MKCQIIKSKGQWYVRIVAANHKVLLHSEKYKRKRDAEHLAELVCCRGEDIPVYHVGASTGQKLR